MNICHITVISTGQLSVFLLLLMLNLRFSSPEQPGSQARILMLRRPSLMSSTISNVFSSETALPNKVKFHVKPPLEGGNESLFKS